MGQYTCTTATVEETEALGAQLVHLLPVGTVLALIGSLGAGKTALTRGMVQGFLGDCREYSSPTFTLCQSYGPNSCGQMLHHFDVYRLETPEAFVSAGLEEYLSQENGICVIEWANLITPLLPVSRTCLLQIEIPGPLWQLEEGFEGRSEVPTAVFETTPDGTWDLSQWGVQEQLRSWQLETPAEWDKLLRGRLLATGIWKEKAQ